MTDSYDFATLAETTGTNSTLSALFFGMTIFASILGIIMIISYWKIFSKKGKPGWAILVPIYNVIVQIQVANLSMIYFLLLLIPVVNIYAIIKINISMAKSFGKSAGFGVGMILLPVIFIPLLAFADIKEESSSNESTNNFDAMNVINNNGTNPNNETVGIEPIQTVDINPAINNEIPTIDNNVENNDSIENVNNTVPDNQSENIQTISESTNNNNIITANPLENIPVINENTTNDNSINNNPVENIPTLESNVVEQNIVDNNTVNNIEQTNNENNIANNTILEAPVLDNNVNNEVSSTTIDTKINNDMPVNNLTNNVETPTVNESGVETLNMNDDTNINAFNVKPVLENESINTNTDNNAVDNTVQDKETSSKKICKSCASEMPDIVSICPVCGTDNE